MSAFLVKIIYTVYYSLALDLFLCSCGVTDVR